MTLEEMIAALEEYYECAGFADFYEEKLKHLSEEGIVELYRETFKDDQPDPEEWAAESRRRHESDACVC